MFWNQRKQFKTMAIGHGYIGQPDEETQCSSKPSDDAVRTDTG